MNELVNREQEISNGFRNFDQLGKIGALHYQFSILSSLFTGFPQGTNIRIDPSLNPPPPRAQQLHAHEGKAAQQDPLEL